MRTAAGLWEISVIAQRISTPRRGADEEKGGPQSGSGVSGAPRSEVQMMIGKLVRRLLV